MRRFPIRFLHESVDSETPRQALRTVAGDDVPVFRGRSRGLDSERDQQPGGGRRGFDRGSEPGRVVDRVIGRQNQHEGVPVAHGEYLGSGGDGGHRVPSGGFQDDGFGLYPDFAQLFNDKKAMRFAHRDGGCERSPVGDAQRRLLQQAAVGHEAQKLLGAGNLGLGPQPCPSPPRQDHGMNESQHTSIRPSRIVAHHLQHAIR